MPDLFAPRLEALEAIVERRQDGRQFVNAGHALKEIREKRLYENRYGPKFDQYCRDRWGFQPSRAGQLIAAAEVADVLHGGPASEKTELPNEHIARELASIRFQPEKVHAVWERAKKVAAAIVKERGNSNGRSTMSYMTVRNALVELYPEEATSGARQQRRREIASATRSRNGPRPPAKREINRLRESTRKKIEARIDTMVFTMGKLATEVSELVTIPIEEFIKKYIHEGHMLERTSLRTLHVFLGDLRRELRRSGYWDECGDDD